MRLTKNNLLPWFTEDHKDLPAWYLKSCREFFESIKQQAIQETVPYNDIEEATSNKHQASKAQAATKCQATSKNKND